jgi:hypothetical protein
MLTITGLRRWKAPCYCKQILLEMLEDLREQIIGIIEETHACKGQDKWRRVQQKHLMNKMNNSLKVCNTRLVQHVHSFFMQVH